jgi:hypothetical protein
VAWQGKCPKETALDRGVEFSPLCDGSTTIDLSTPAAELGKLPEKP